MYRLQVLFRSEGSRLEKRQCTAFKYYSDQREISHHFPWSRKENLKWRKASLALGGECRLPIKCLASPTCMCAMANQEGLRRQIQADFKKSVADANGLLWIGLPDGTDLWQPVDAGYAACLRALIAIEHRNWLDIENNEVERALVTKNPTQTQKDVFWLNSV